MRLNEITFVWQNMNNHTVNTLQWKTAKRTIEEAWGDAERFLLDRNSSCDPVRLLTFKGLPRLLDDDVPFRAPTKKEIKELLAP